MIFINSNFIEAFLNAIHYHFIVFCSAVINYANYLLFLCRNKGSADIENLFSLHQKPCHTNLVMNILCKKYLNLIFKCRMNFFAAFFVYKHKQRQLYIFILHKYTRYMYVYCIIIRCR